MEFLRPEYWSGSPFSSPGDLPNPGIKPRSPALQVDSLPPEPRGKPKNTGVGSLSLCQQIFLTQESNQGLLHCRRILYRLSYQGQHENHICNQERKYIIQTMSFPVEYSHIKIICFPIASNYCFFLFYLWIRIRIKNSFILITSKNYLVN